MQEPEYLRVCDVAWRRCYGRLAIKVPHVYVARTEIALVGGQQEYTLPSDFRSSISIMIRNESSGTARAIRPLNELDVGSLSVPQTTGNALVRYVPEPVRITAGSTEMDLPGVGDEWIVNAMCRMVTTKEGTDRAFYDADFAELDEEVSAYASLDVGWPIEINDTFPVDSWGGSDGWGLATNLVSGYILSGRKVEFWSYRAPGL